MNATVAKELLAQELELLEAQEYRDVAEMIDSSVVKTRVGRDGKGYQIEIQAFWDSKPKGDVRLICSVDDGGLRAFAPISNGILKKKPIQSTQQQRP